MFDDGDRRRVVLRRDALRQRRSNVLLKGTPMEEPK
jgi:hypothetical protein